MYKHPERGRAVRRNTGTRHNGRVKLNYLHTHQGSPLFSISRASSRSLHRHPSVAQGHLHTVRPIYFRHHHPSSQPAVIRSRTALRSINCPRRTDARRSNTIDSPDVMEISQELATEEDGEPSGIGVTLASRQQAGKLSLGTIPLFL